MASNASLPPLTSLLPVGQTDIDATNDDRMTALMDACDQGSSEKAMALIHHGADVNIYTTGYYGNIINALFLACERGLDTVVKLLLECGAEVTVCDRDRGRDRGDDDYYYSALESACYYGHSSIAMMIMNKFPYIYELKNQGFLSRSLNAACINGLEKVVNVMLRKGVNVEYQDFDWTKTMTALVHACLHGHDSVAISLIEHGARSDPIDDFGRHALRNACEKEMTGVIDLLIENGIGQFLAFHCLLTCSNTACLLPVFLYFATGCHKMKDDSNKPQSVCTTSVYSSKSECADNNIALHSSNNEENGEEKSRVLSYIFENWDDCTSESYIADLASIDDNVIRSFSSKVKEILSVISDYEIGLVLRGAIENGKLGSIQLLYEHGVDLMNTPLLVEEENCDIKAFDCICCYNQSHMIEWFIAVPGIDKKSVCDAMYWAHQNRNTPGEPCAYYHLDNGYDGPRTENRALHIACVLGIPQVVQLLIDFGLGVNDRDLNGRFQEDTAVLAAVKDTNCRYKCLQILLRSGADIEMADLDNSTVLTHALSNRCEECVTLLMSHGALTCENRLKSCHLQGKVRCFDEHFESTDCSFKERRDIFEPDGLLLAVKLGIFDWHLVPERDCVWFYPHAIEAGIPPGSYLSKEGHPVSILVQSFKENLLDLTREVLNTVYYLPEDYQHLRALCSEKRGKEDFDEDYRQFLDHVIDTPLTLKEWSVLEISKAICMKGLPRQRRELVDALPLPERMKKMLMFRN